MIIGTVVPRALHNLSRCSPTKYFKVEPLVAGQRAAEWPIALDVDEPQSVGAGPGPERHRRPRPLHEGDLIVIDFGTATTFDVVDFTGAYKGGIIAPGINLSLDAWSPPPPSCRGSPSRRRRTPASSAEPPRSQMLIGIYWGYVAMIEGLVARLKAEIGRPSRSSPPAASPPCSTSTELFDAIEPDLTIQGLSLLQQAGRQQGGGKLDPNDPRRRNMNRKNFSWRSAARARSA